MNIVARDINVLAY